MTVSLTQSVLITSASTEIGTVYADRFAGRGHDLVLVARNRARMEELADRLRKEKGVEVDIVLPGVMEVDELVDAALAGFYRRETVTIPPLPDAAQWIDFEAARQVMIPNFSQAHAAARYRHLAA